MRILYDFEQLYTDEIPIEWYLKLLTSPDCDNLELGNGQGEEMTCDTTHDQFIARYNFAMCEEHLEHYFKVKA